MNVMEFGFVLLFGAAIGIHLSEIIQWISEKRLEKKLAKVSK